MDSLEGLKKRLRPFLRKYLESRGVEISESGHFLCPNPRHNDGTPSAHIVSDTNEEQWYCFGCWSKGDIASAAHWYEGLPLSGPEFITENIEVLAQRFGIPFEPIKMSEQDIYKAYLKRLYRNAADTLVEFHENRELLDERGWSKRLCWNMRVGVVTSWQEFRQRLIAKGDYTVKDLEDGGIYNTLFNPHCITFTIFDEFGNPVGFSSRDSRYGTIQNVKKWRITERKIQIFHKDEVLYGFHTMRQKPVQTTVVEGYGDVLTAMECGIEGFVGVLTSSLTDSQVELLRKYNKNDVVLCLDHDQTSYTGQTKMEKCIDDVLSGKRDLQVHIVDLGRVSPEASMDPDDFLRKQEDPRAAWTALPKESAFGWRLSRLEGLPPEVVSDRMIRLIFNEPQHAKQETMLQQLSESTGIRLKALEGDLDDYLYETDRRRRDEAKEILDTVSRKLRYANPVTADEILQTSAQRIKNLRRDVHTKITSRMAVETVEGIQERFLNKSGELPGLKTGWSKFNENIGGVPREDCMFVIGGIPHSGKTSFCSHLAWDLVRLNDDVCVLYMSTDDSMAQIYPKFVSLETMIPITHVANPKRWLSGEKEYAKWTQGWNQLKHLVQVGYLEVRDATAGTSVACLAHWIEEKKKAFPDRQIVAMLDNFHKIGESGAGEKIRERFRNASEEIKQLSQSGRTTIIMTAELAKAADPKNPTLRDLLETGQIFHDATIGCVCHNETVLNPNCSLVWTDESAPEDKRYKPVVEMRVQKNKSLDGAWLGGMWFRFDPERALFIEGDNR